MPASGLRLIEPAFMLSLEFTEYCGKLQIERLVVWSCMAASEVSFILWHLWKGQGSCESEIFPVYGEEAEVENCQPLGTF